MPLPGTQITVVDGQQTGTDQYPIRIPMSRVPSIPTSPPGNPIMWFDAQDVDGAGNTSMVDGAAVATWVNKGTIGSAGNAVQPTPSKRPIFSASIDPPQISNKAGVMFDGVNDCLRSSPFTLQAGPWTFGMLSRIVPNGTQAMFGTATSTTYVQGTNFHMGGSIDAATGLVVATDSGQWEVYTGVYNGASTVARLLGLQATVDSGTSSVDRVSIGALAAQEQWFFSGPIVELVIYAGAGQPTQIQIENYFAQKYRMSTRIMYCGDSITQGVGGAGPEFVSLGWRGRLWNSFPPWSLRPLGGLSDGITPRPQHEGFGGLRIAQIAATIGGGLSSFRPNICTFMGGTNNATGGETSSSMLTDIAGAVDACFAAGSVTLVLLASPPPRNDGDVVAQNTTSDFAAGLPGVVAAKTAAGKPCIYIPVFESLNTSDILSSNVHPNDQGYGKIASLFAAAIQPYLTSPLS
jgi:lysophospholipase L1-like esterase